MSDPLGRYLRPGRAQSRVIAAMASGHARAKHGAELGNPGRAAYASQVRVHLRQAPIAVAVSDPGGRPRLLVADPQTDKVAWVTPHREHRSTFFSPRRGAAAYVKAQEAISPPGRWQPLDADSLRRATPTRSARRIVSAVRGRNPPDVTR